MWAITSEERTKHDKQFDNLKPSGGYITGLCSYFICDYMLLFMKYLIISFNLTAINLYYLMISSMVVQMVKNRPAMEETWVRPLSQEDPLEKGMATQSSVLALRIPWTENLAGYSPRGCKESGHDWTTNVHVVSFPSSYAQM